MSKSKCGGHLSVEEGELSRFIDSFRAKLDVDEATIIYLTLPQSFASPNLRADLPVYPFPSSNAG